MSSMNDLGGIEILDIFTDDGVSIESMSNFLATTSDFNANVSDFGLDLQFLTTPMTSSPSPSATTSVEASSSDSEELVAKRPIKKRHRERPKQEIEYLKVKHDELMEQLRALQKTQTITIASPWKARAMNQAQSVQRSLQENNRLKTMVQDQLKVIQSLERILVKRPKLSSFPSNDGLWKQAILGTTNREAELEALMQHQYDQLESEWIRLKMYEAISKDTPVKKSIMQTSDDEVMQLGHVVSMTMPLPFEIMADIFWQHKTGLLGPTCETLTSFHPNLVYTREDVVLPDDSMPILESRDSIRRYVESERVVLLWRSILEDHLIPHDESNMISNRWGWMVVQYKSPLECYVQGYVITTTPIFPLNSRQPTVGTLTELLIRGCQENKEKFGSSMEKAVHEAQAKLGVLKEHRFVFEDSMCAFKPEN